MVKDEGLPSVTRGVTPLDPANRGLNRVQKLDHCAFCGGKRELEVIPNTINSPRQGGWCYRCRTSYRRGFELLGIIREKIATEKFSVHCDVDLLKSLSRELIFPHEVLEVIHLSQDVRHCAQGRRKFHKENRCKLSLCLIFLVAFAWHPQCQLHSQRRERENLWCIIWDSNTVFHFPESAIPNSVRESLGLKNLKKPFDSQSFSWMKPLTEEVHFRKGFSPQVP